MQHHYLKGCFKASFEVYLLHDSGCDLTITGSPIQNQICYWSAGLCSVRKRLAIMSIDRVVVQEFVLPWENIIGHQIPSVARVKGRRYRNLLNMLPLLFSSSVKLFQSSSIIEYVLHILARIFKWMTVVVFLSVLLSPTQVLCLDTQNSLYPLVGWLTSTTGYSSILWYVGPHKNVKWTHRFRRFEKMFVSILKPPLKSDNFLFIHFHSGLMMYFLGIATNSFYFVDAKKNFNILFCL